MTGINATSRAEERVVDGKPHKGDYDLRVGPPLACIVDTDVIRKAPWRYQEAGFADYIAKSIVELTSFIDTRSINPLRCCHSQ